MERGRPQRALAAARAQWDRVRSARADLRAARARAEEGLGVSRDLADGQAQLAARIAQLTAEQTHAHKETRERLDTLSAAVAGLLDQHSADHDRLMDALRVIRDDDLRARAQLGRLRESADYDLSFAEDQPLVSIVITTYNNWALLKQRALPAILSQTYQHFEVLVIGDAAPPEAADAVASFGDPRLRFHNLPYRGPYPDLPRDAWYGSGSNAFNAGLSRAQGSWIACCGDDDAFRPDHLQVLLQLARDQRAEVAYGSMRQLGPDGSQELLTSFPPRHTQWGTQCSLFHAGLRFMPMHTTDWIFRLANDSALLERMLRIGVRFAFVDHPVVDYYPSALWKTRPD